MAAAGVGRLFLVSIFLCSFAATCFGAEIFLKNLPNDTLTIKTASSMNGTSLKSGIDNITVTWGLAAGKTIGVDDKAWKSVIVKLCYGPISQKDRAWRKTAEPIKKDKQCQFKITKMDYTSTQTTDTWVVKRDTPTAYYFIRTYALDAAGHEVAYGQTANKNMTTEIFFVEAVTRRHVSLDIASVTFSAFSVVSLFGFFYMEKRKARLAAK